MIKLKKIKKNDNLITCEAFVENCKQAMPLIYNIKKGELEEYEFPDGYDYCDSHISHARRYLRSIANSDNIPENKLIMWY